MVKITRVIVVILALNLYFKITAAVAQEATERPVSSGNVLCDSDLILNLYTAEHFFGFSQILGLVPNPDPALTADVNTFDKGQYTSLFNSLTSPVPIVSLAEEERQGIANMIQLDETTFQNQMTSMLPSGIDLTTVTSLSPSPISGEDPSCTVLRRELNRFYTILNLQHLRVGGTVTGTNTTTGTDLTSTPGTVVPNSGIGTSNSTGSSISGNGGATSNGNLPGTGAQLTPPPGGGSPGG